MVDERAPGPDGSTARPAGRSGIAVPIALPRRLARLRATHDLAASQGARPHVTILYPFLACDRLDRSVRAGIREIAAGVAPFEVRFERVRRFDGVVWIEPEPAAPFRAMTEEIVARWPDHPPYEGRFEVVIPHLTIAETTDGPLARIEAETAAALPFRSQATRLEVWCQDDHGRWRPRWRVPFTGPVRP